jgi:Bacterial regulatory helix-turn-helix protein, lysR family
MLDGISLDQLHTFLAAADEGSFSAAGRRLRRGQSVVSQSLANLEGQLGVKLFDRSGRPASWSSSFSMASSVRHRPIVDGAATAAAIRRSSSQRGGARWS